jgi:circadian clock protein KaiC
MLTGGGYYRGSTILVSGTAGTGKSSLAASFVKAASDRKERCLYFAFEESPQQIMRNMRSIGLDLAPALSKGYLSFHAGRPSEFGLEMHLAIINKVIGEAKPDVVVLDPISNLIAVGNVREVKSMLTRLIDLLKSKAITALFTDLVHGGSSLESSNEEISSLIDTWISLRDLETQNERNRGLHIVKSRGMAHSNQIREFLLTNKGIQILDVYLGSTGVLTGSARMTQEARERADAAALLQMQARKKSERQRKRAELERHIAQLRAEFEANERENEEIEAYDATVLKRLIANREAMARIRKADHLADRTPAESATKTK